MNDYDYLLEPEDELEPLEPLEPGTVVVIDDNPEEVAAAEKAVRDAGFKVRAIQATARRGVAEEIWGTLDMPGVIGVLTDLMFPLTKNSGVQPNGVLVAAHAISKGIPVVLCTNGAETGNRHLGSCGAVRDGYHEEVDEPFFGFVDDKNWRRAVSILKRRMEGFRGRPD